MAARLRQGADVLHDWLNRRDTLVELIRSVNATVEPPTVADALLAYAEVWFSTRHLAVAVDDGSRQINVIAERGDCRPFAEGLERVARWVTDHNEEFMSANLETDRRLPGGPPVAIAAFPLRCRARTIGALIALDPTPASTAPELPASVLSSLRVVLEAPALAIDTTMHLQRAEALSVTDDLTSLYNSRYLNQVLRRESKRASRSSRPLSLLFIDLDGFKGVNDKHGHLCGSRALVEAAAVIRGCARETDMCARFGGDEFAVVLPETGSEGAIAVAERIRERVSSHSFLAGEGINYRLTASVGVAALPEVATTAEELIKAADMAMYRVKDGGKNGVLLATRN
ncbi:MAG: GGDEF domain-containing protein [Vicinamibacterales bacterium]|nr:GGDEF domain-containing protein [Vicinamibacterales bacterium]